MKNTISETNDCPARAFIFTGRGWTYFRLCLLNTLLTIITCGIYLPWARVSCRRYILSHTETDGKAFRYEATGLSLFTGWLFIVVLSALYVLLLLNEQTTAAYAVVLLFLCVIPLMAVRNLRYQAEKTLLGHTRFGFQCSLPRAWWGMLGLPALSLGLLFIVFRAEAWLLPDDAGLTTALAVYTLTGIGGLGLVNAVSLRSWMNVLGNGMMYGRKHFHIHLHRASCVRGCMLALASLLPFILLMVYLLSPFLDDNLPVFLSGDLADEGADGALSENDVVRLLMCYILYLLALIVASGYMQAFLRNQFLHHLTFSDGRVSFRSTLRGHAMVSRLLLIYMLSILTLGLAYPVLRVRYLSWLAGQTYMTGSVSEDDVNVAPESSGRPRTPWFSRAVMPRLPFL